MPIDKNAFQQDLLDLSEEAIVEKYYLAAPAAHVSDDDVSHAKRMLGAAFQVSPEDIDIVVTGSAKLGFTTVNKTNDDGSPRPAFTDFDSKSDIDLAVISPMIFQLLWDELSYFASRQARFPWSNNKLGNYLISGWLRPDHFPRNVGLPYVDEWWPAFERISKNTRFGRRKVRGGLFNSRHQLDLYLRRAIRDLKD